MSPHQPQLVPICLQLPLRAQVTATVKPSQARELREIIISHCCLKPFSFRGLVVQKQMTHANKICCWAFTKFTVIYSTDLLPRGI